MAEVSGPLQAAQLHIVQMEREGVDPDVIREHMDALNKEVEKATYVVEVYQCECHFIWFDLISCTHIS